MSTNANPITANEVGGSIPTRSKNLFLQRAGEICLSNNFQSTLDNVELATQSKIEIQIGGHWILGTVIKLSRAWLWYSENEGVAVDIMFGIRARRITNTSASQM